MLNKINLEVVEMEKDLFEQYLKDVEGDKSDKTYLWSTAIGLQDVDGLRPSKYLIDTAIENIEGKITIKQAQELIDSYYKEKDNRSSDMERTEEADKVSSRIAQILSEKAFSFTPNEYISIHRKLFQGIYIHAGKIRDYNITKKEWVLDGATVIYGSASELGATLEYDFNREREFSYKNLSMDDIIKINIIHLNSIVIISLLSYLVSSGVHLYIPMIMLVSIDNNRVTFDKFILVQSHGARLSKKRKI